MNILIVAAKSNIKTYENVAKSAPNTSVLGAVTSVSLNFISELKDKWHPHMVIIDTDVPTKKTNIIDVIEDIHKYYPYIKTVVLTDAEDNYSYTAYAIIRGQVSSIEFKDILNRAIADINNNIDSGITEKLTHRNENNISYSETSFDKTEELYGKTYYADNLSTSTHKTKIKRQKVRGKKRITSKNIIYITCIALAVLITIIAVCIVLKNCNSEYSSATSDEATTHIIYNTEEQSEEEITESELIVSFTDPSRTEATVNINDNAVTSVPAESGSKSENNSSSNNTNTDSNNKSSVSKTSDYDNNSANSDSSDSRVSDSLTSSKTESYNNSSEYSNQKGGSVSQSINKYNNSNTNSVQSIKLSYSQKTLTVDEYITLSATVSPPTAYYTLNYSSSNTSVCTVDPSGTVTAKKAGTATITATAGEKSTTCKIIVNPKPISTPTSPPATADPVKLSYTTYTIVSGQTFTLKLYNASSVSWKINYPGIITTVGGSATQINIKGLKTGTATVYATNNATGKQYTCLVTVK